MLNAREADGVTPVIPHEYCMTNVCTYCSRTSSARAIAERNGACPHAAVCIAVSDGMARSHWDREWCRH